jgi:hypothetical protein
MFFFLLQSHANLLVFSYSAKIQDLLIQKMQNAGYKCTPLSLM